MFIKIMEFINTIHSTNINNNSDPVTSSLARIKWKIRDYVSEVKIILDEMISSREKEIELFTITFQKIVEKYKRGKNSALNRPLLPTLDPHEPSDIPITIPNSTLEVQAFILNKLFFNDLLFYYYDFCYRMNFKFSKMNNICEKKLEEIDKLLTQVRKDGKFSVEEFGIGSFSDFLGATFNIYTFSKILECIVRKSLKIENYKRSSIYCVLDRDPIDFEENYMPYAAIHHFIKCYNTEMTKEEDPCFRCKVRIQDLRNYSSSYIAGKYLKFISLNIIEEYKKNSQLPNDKRFNTYKNTINIIYFCEDCNTYCDDMLRNPICDFHRNELLFDIIRAEYFEFMDCS